MDAQLKAKWVEALRSGEFKQGHYELKNEDDDTRYCCLGVLCVVADKPLAGDSYRWLDRATGDYGKLVQMNDDRGNSFAEIADWIEENL